MNAPRRSDAPVAAAIAAPALMWSDADSSRAGVTITAGSGGWLRPPMNHSGMSTPQSIGATAVDGSLDPKLTAAAGGPGAGIGPHRPPARVVSDGTSRAIGGRHPVS